MSGGASQARPRSSPAPRRGIGRALALGLAAEGAVVHLARPRRPSRACSRELPAAGAGLALRCDVSDAAEIRAAFSQPRSARCARQLRRRHGLDRRHRSGRGDLGSRDRHEPERDVLLLDRGRPADARGRRWLDRQRLVGARRQGHAELGRLCRQQGRDQRPHRSARDRARPVPDPGQRDSRPERRTSSATSPTTPPTSRSWPPRDPTRPRRRARGHGRPGRIPRLGRFRSRHRPAVLRRRRLDRRPGRSRRATSTAPPGPATRTEPPRQNHRGRRRDSLATREARCYSARGSRRASTPNSARPQSGQ